MIRLNLFMIWFLHFLSLLSVICRCYRRNSSSRIIVILVYTVSTLFLCITNKFINRHIGAYGTLFNLNWLIMKQNEKKEELQSRREFFKKAAKSLLPILGAITLTSTPGIVKAAEKTTNCNYSCSFSCSSRCSGTCSGSCYGYCGGACSYSCQNTCKGSCQSTCSGTCSGRCSYSCYGSCSGGCSRMNSF